MRTISARFGVLQISNYCAAWVRPSADLSTGICLLKQSRLVGEVVGCLVGAVGSQCGVHTMHRSALLVLLIFSCFLFLNIHLFHVRRYEDEDIQERRNERTDERTHLRNWWGGLYFFIFPEHVKAAENGKSGAGGTVRHHPITLRADPECTNNYNYCLHVYTYDIYIYGNCMYVCIMYASVCMYVVCMYMYQVLLLYVFMNYMLLHSRSRSSWINMIELGLVTYILLHTAVVLLLYIQNRATGIKSMPSDDDQPAWQTAQSKTH